MLGNISDIWLPLVGDTVRRILGRTKVSIMSRDVLREHLFLKENILWPKVAHAIRMLRIVCTVHIVANREQPKPSPT